MHIFPSFPVYRFTYLLTSGPEENKKGIQSLQHVPANAQQLHTKNYQRFHKKLTNKAENVYQNRNRNRKCFKVNKMCTKSGKSLRRKKKEKNA